MEREKKRMKKAIARYEVIAPILLGYKNISQVSRESGFERKTVREWIRRYREGKESGIEALKDRPRRRK